MAGGCDQFRPAQQQVHQRHLGLLGQAFARGVAGGLVERPALLRELAEQRADAGVRVLHVVDGVVVGVRAREVEVEVEVLVVAAHHVEEARRVGAHFLPQLAQGHELAGAGRHLHLLALLEQHRELHQLDLQPRRIQAEPLRGGLQARDVAVVVGAEDVDRALEAAVELVQQVGDVGREVGGHAVLAHHHAVLLVAEGGGLEPQRAVALRHVALGLQRVDRLRHRPGGGQRALAEPVVVAHAEFAEVLLDVGQAPFEAGVEHQPVVGLAEQFLGARDQGVDVGFPVAALGFVRRQAVGHLEGVVAQAVAFLRAQRARDLDHVVALVAVVGKAHLHAAEFQVAQPDAGAEDVHLPAGVVDVVLAVHLVAAGFEDVGQGGAVGRAAAVADVQRAVGVGGDELHRHRLARFLRLPAVAVALLEHAAHGADQAGRADPEVDEAGAGDLGTLDEARLRQGVEQLLGQLARAAPDALGHQHRDVAGVVAVRLVARALDGEVRFVARRQFAVAPQVEDRLQHQFADQFFHGGVLRKSRLV